jgi:hypothetical protein
VSDELSVAFVKRITRDDIESLDRLGFEQVDDSWGVVNVDDDDEGDDVVVWLHPVRGGVIVDHDAGPFDAVRVEFSVLRNPVARVKTFTSLVEALSKMLDTPSTRDGHGVNTAQLVAEADVIIARLRAEGIEPGSDDALELER